MSWKPPVIGSRPVVVLGAGVLGRRIACSYIAAGYNVHIRDPFPEARQAALDFIDSSKQEYAGYTKTPSPREFGTYKAFEDIETAVADAFLIIEAVPEKLELKIETFGLLDQYAPADCILGSNSSSYRSGLMLDKVSPERRRSVCNIHYTMPMQIRSVELMTDGETYEEIFPFLHKILEETGMIPVTARKESTGFIFNRLWAAVKRETMMILAEGVSDPKEIDKLWSHMFQTNVAPCSFMDRVGLDTVANIEDNYIRERNLGSELTVDWLRDNYVSKGKTGLKSDKGGFYSTPQTSSNPPPPSSSFPSSESSPSPSKISTPPSTPVDRAPTSLYFLDAGLGGNLADINDMSKNGKIIRHNLDTGRTATIVSGLPLPDGIDISPSTGRMFWTNMGRDMAHRNGSIMSSKIDGSDIQTLIPEGGVHTPKQLVVSEKQRKIYFCDREGLGVHRCDFDGSNHEILIQRRYESEKPDLTQWCVGIAVDDVNGKVYWTQKGPSKASQGRIFRAGVDMPAGETNEHRSDIEVVLENLPEPIDLELDVATQTLYWTDRGEHPRGCTLNRAYVGSEGVKIRGHREILARHFHEPIGLKVDVERAMAFVVDLGGSVYRVLLDSGKKEVLHSDDGSYTGITVV